MALTGMLLVVSMPALADYRADVGFTSLDALPGPGAPTGAGVNVSQVEALYTVNGVQTFMPDASDTEFLGKNLVDRSGAPAGVYSEHATSVGRWFYGNQSSISPGITDVDVYDATKWLGTGFLRTAGVMGPQPWASTARIANHSWVGSGDAFNAERLQRLDWVIDRDEFIQVVAVNNGPPNQPLLANAFNVISVGRSDGGHATGSVAVDNIYTAGRTRPDVVAPNNVTSTTTPGVAAAVAILVEWGHANAGLSTDPVSQPVTNRAGATVRNAERSEVIRAAILAGASRQTRNTVAPDITDYRLLAANQTANGLDARFGAGQLNVLNSYLVINAGEQNSLEDEAAGAGAVAATGFDYDPRFGGYAGTNATATYYLPVPATSGRLAAALVWNLKIAGGTAAIFSGTATLYDLNLELFDVTDAANWVSVGSSASTNENTENLWLPLTGGRKYALRVTRGPAQVAFDWDCALAWRLELGSVADTDGDGVPDDVDNCTLAANTDQFDGDGDGYGNRCDGDFNNDGFTNAQDSILLRQSIGTGDFVTDLNHDSFVNAQDVTIFRKLLGKPSGPSALRP